MERLLLVGLDEAEHRAIRDRVTVKVSFRPDLPRVKLKGGELLVERSNVLGAYLPVDRVIFHGIFEDDYDLLTALALWGGPCLPGALGLLNCRRRAPALARAAAVSSFAALPRGFGYGGQPVGFRGSGGWVAKWGVWHCGEDKALIPEGAEPWRCDQPTVLEPFIEGEAVRLAIVGDRAWQIRLTGEGWLKSIHGPGAEMMPIDQRLLEDARRLAAHFGLQMAGVDYMLDRDGEPHLLEVNHAPNVTAFKELREAFLDLALGWVATG